MIIDYDDHICGDKFKAAFAPLGVYANIDDAPIALSNREYKVTHNGDNPIHEGLLDEFFLQAWAGTNVCVDDDRCFPIPIGLENDHIGGQPGRKRKLFRSRELPVVYADSLCYYNCSPTHPDREIAKRHFFCQPWCTMHDERLIYEEYLGNILAHPFIVCPRGNGLDTHRTWETLYLSRYPVMKREWSLERLYADLPVLFVNEWCEVTEDLLKEAIGRFAYTKFNYDKLRFSYWHGYVKGLIT